MIFSSHAIQVDKNTKRIDLTSHTKTRRFRSQGGVEIGLPVQRELLVMLPQGLSEDKPTFSHHPFPMNPVTFDCFHPHVDVLASLMRPKKLAIQGSDGHVYAFLAKPKDDLRKDTRMMDFNHMVNRLLAVGGETRRRGLYIRTYAVTPLTEECGLIEWVSNMKGLRHILQDLYCDVGVLTNQQIMHAFSKGKSLDPVSKDSRDFREDVLARLILPQFPPIFHRFFLDIENFPTPVDWHRARFKYARTLAVMCMVGWVVGLGDRHSENILFDTTTGECMHVDLACLFDKGKQLDVPEVVPFRLTQNLVDGLPGVSGCEGVFRISCDLTMTVMRHNKDLLMNVLEPFVHGDHSISPIAFG